MPDRVQKKIGGLFGEYQFTKNEDETGVGLGLTVVRKLSEALKLEAKVTTKQQEGTIFDLFLSTRIKEPPNSNYPFRAHLTDFSVDSESDQPQIENRLHNLQRSTNP